MKKLMLGLSVAAAMIAFGAGAASAAPASGVALGQAAAVNHTVDKAYYVVRRGYYGRGGGCRSVRVCGAYGCRFVRRCW